MQVLEGIMENSMEYFLYVFELIIEWGSHDRSKWPRCLQLAVSVLTDLYRRSVRSLKLYLNQSTPQRKKSCPKIRIVVAIFRTSS